MTFSRDRKRGPCGVVLILVLGLLTSCLCVRSTFAQVAGAASPQTPSPQTPPALRRRAQTIDDRVKMLAKGLDLNETQQSAVKKILEQRQQETLRIKRDPSISGQARIEQFRALQDNTVEKIRAVLSEQQRQKYDPIATRKLQQAPERSVEDWLKATTPH